MTEVVTLYGFGSFFASAVSAPSDIDILIVHDRVDPASIDFAICCKRKLRHFLPSAHFTILSESEEHELSFIQRCSAIMLERITDAEPDLQLGSLALALEPLWLRTRGLSQGAAGGGIFQNQP
jgi:hypothetical protein